MTRDTRHRKEQDPIKRTVPLVLSLLAAIALLGLSTAATAGEGDGTAEGTSMTPKNAKEAVHRYRKVVKSKDLETYRSAARQVRLAMIQADPHRPLYHFTGVESWINDPNGPIYHKGKYHLFYQFDPIVPAGNGLARSARCWGHAVSKDLVHWEDWPVAIWPDSRYDRAGVFSGNTFVHEGKLHALYTGNVRGHEECYGILAWSDDGGLTFKKKMVMANKQRPYPETPVHWDAQIWKEGDTWCQLIGARTKDKRGAAMLWKSKDLHQWTVQKNIARAIRHAHFWELPYLVPLGGRHVLMVGAGNSYWVGRYDPKEMLFTPETPVRPVDTGWYYSFNPHMVDDKGPNGSERRIMHGWATGPASPTKSVPYWQGAHSIPRVLTLVGDRLWQEPVPEIQCLRDKHRAVRDVSREDALKDIKGDALELTATFAPGAAKRFGIKLRVSPDGRSFTRVYFDTNSRTFGVDGRALPIRPQNSYLKRGENVQMHIFLDRSFVEVYINGSALTARTFPSREALGLEMFSEGGKAELKSLDIWTMKSMWE